MLVWTASAETCIITNIEVTCQNASMIHWSLRMLSIKIREFTMINVVHTMILEELMNVVLYLHWCCRHQRSSSTLNLENNTVKLIKIVWEPCQIDQDQLFDTFHVNLNFYDIATQLVDINIIMKFVLEFEMNIYSMSRTFNKEWSVVLTFTIKVSVMHLNNLVT